MHCSAMQCPTTPTYRMKGLHLRMHGWAGFWKGGNTEKVVFFGALHIYIYIYIYNRNPSARLCGHNLREEINEMIHAWMTDPRAPVNIYIYIYIYISYIYIYVYIYIIYIDMHIYIYIYIYIFDLQSRLTARRLDEAALSKRQGR